MARPGLTTHRKFKRLARALGSHIIARGALELLWDTAYESGNDYVGTSDDVEAAVGWAGDAGALTRALADAGAPEGVGFIEPIDGDVNKPKRYRIHDLYHHAPEYVSNRRARETERRTEKRCARCGNPFHSSDPRRDYCSPACRQAAWRERQRGEGDLLRTGDGPLQSETDRYGTHSTTPTPTPSTTPIPTRVPTPGTSTAASTSPLRSVTHPSPAEPQPAEARSKHPVFKGQRFVVFDWMLDDLRRLLGAAFETFDMHAWFYELDARAEKASAVVPQRDGGKWLQDQTLIEAARRGLEIAAAPATGKTAGNRAAGERFIARGQVR